MSPTMQEIANRAGVTKMTVSRVLNKADVSIKESTRQKVMDIARELNYRPNLFAKSLKKGRTNCIGLLGNMGIANFTSPYITGVVSGVEKAMIADGRGYSLLAFGGTNADGAAETRDLIRKGLVDGLIFIMIADYLADFEKELLPLLKETDVPFVVIHSLKTDLPYNNVGVDMEQAGYLAARHLFKKGHTDIHYYTHEPKKALSLQLEAGVTRACDEKGITRKARMRISPRAGGHKFFIKAFETFSTIKNFPRAVIMPTDQTCLGLTQAACRRGIRIPDDCDVVRISDAPTIREVLPGIPYVHHPVTEKAKAALTMLLDILEGKRDGGTVQQEILEPEYSD